MMILHKKRNTRDIKNCRPISLVSHMYKTNQENRLVSEKVTQLLIIFIQLIN